MATITFRTKAKNVYHADGTLSHTVIIVPTLKRAHCDMNAFRFHPKFGDLANSDLFPNALARIKRDRLGDYIRLDRIPDGVTVDQTGFLAEVTIDV